MVVVVGREYGLLHLDRCSVLAGMVVTGLLGLSRPERRFSRSR